MREQEAQLAPLLHPLGEGGRQQGAGAAVQVGPAVTAAAEQRRERGRGTGVVAAQGR